MENECVYNSKYLSKTHKNSLQMCKEELHLKEQRKKKETKIDANWYLNEKSRQRHCIGAVISDDMVLKVEWN